LEGSRAFETCTNIGNLAKIVSKFGEKI